MRIGFDAYCAFLNVSGLGNYSRMTIDILARHYAIGYKYFLMSGFDANESGFVIPEGIEVVTPTGMIGNVSPYVWRNFMMAGDLRLKKIDLFHGLTNFLPADVRRGGAKSVVTIHDIAFLKYPNLYSAFDRYMLNKRYKFSCHYSDIIIATSQQTKEDIMENYNVSSERIEVVGQACCPIFKKSYSEDKFEKIKSKYNLPERFLLSVGTLEERKNLTITLHAMASGKFDDLHLVACGKYTDYAETLMTYARELKIADRIHFIQNIHFYDLPIVYQCAEALVYMSLYEGFGLPILEAFDAGTPVITSNQGVLKETGGDACLFVGPHDLEGMVDAIESVTTDESVRNILIDKGKKRSLLYDGKKIADDIFSVYNKLM
ncbi:MAG: glycosyltransferase family 1 protein [Rikenellaceae bacterium]